MSKSSPGNRPQLFAASAVAIVALGLLAVSPSAHAYPTVPLAPWDPPCQDWKRNGALVINTPSQRLEISWDRHVAKGPALLFYKDKATTPILRGSVNGGISGGHLDFTIAWEHPGGFHIAGPTHFVGDIDPDWGTVRGRATYENGQKDDWSANESFDCAMRAPAAKPAAPAPAALKTATVTGDVDVYNIAADEEPEEDGVTGVKIGMLRAGQQVEIGEPCKPSDWCKVLTPELPGGLGFIWGHLSF